MPEINATELCFLKSSNDITVGGLDEIPHDCDEFSGEIEPKKKGNDSDMEISEDDGKDTEEYADSKSDVFSDYREHEGFDNNEPDHQKSKDIQIPLLVTYIISWR